MRSSVHAFLLPAGIVPGAIAFVLEIHLAITYRAAFGSMLAARVSVGARELQNQL